MRLPQVLSLALSPFAARARRAASAEPRVHVELRDAGAEDLARVAAELERRGPTLPGVRWVAVNPRLRRAVFAFDGPADEAAARRWVEEAERAAGVDRSGFSDDAWEHPADPEPVRRLLVELAADLLGIALGTSLALSLLPASPTAARAAALLGWVRGSPRLRRRLDARLGAKRADVALGVVGALLHGVAQRPVSALAEAAHRGVLVREAVARARVWKEREPELAGAAEAARAAATPAATRPVPLPDGPIEQYGDRAWLVSLAGFAVSFATTRSFQRAFAALLGGLPRPARVGRDVFAAELGVLLAGRGALALDPEALRRLDRVDCLVLTADLVARDRARAGAVVAAGATTEAEARELAERLFDADAPLAVVTRGGWTLGPLGLLEAGTRDELAARAADLAARGALVLGLARRGDVRAVVEMRMEPRTGVEELITAAHAAELRVVIASRDESLLTGLAADDVVPDGPELGAGIRRLQREGRVVMLVTSAAGGALASADVGVGLVRAGAPAPWAAHLLARDDLADVRFLVEACARARQVSKQSVNVALGAATVAALVSAGGLVQLTTSRVIAVVNVATLVSVANGLGRGFALDRRPLPAPRDRTPWHALDAGGVASRLGTSAEHGLARTEAVRRRERPRAPRPAVADLADAVGDELFNPLAPLLAAGAGLSAVVGSMADAGMLGGVVALNALVGGAQRFRVERALQRLERQVTRRAVAWRDGRLVDVDARELVRGDVIELTAGDVVPADARLLTADGLEVDASSLTGESLPVVKHPACCFEAAVADRSSMVFEGTTVAAGRARAVVVAVGDATESRRSAAVSRRDRAPTGVEQRLAQLVDLTAPVAVGAASAVIAGGLLRGRRLDDLVGSGVSLAVASVPEGLPLLATAAQLSAAERLSKRGALVRNVRAIEALGRVDVLCVDKTGTVTEGRVDLAAVWDGADEQPAATLSGPRLRVLAAALRASVEPAGGAARADPMDAALRRAGDRLAVRADYGVPGWSAVSEVSYESGRGYHAVLARTERGSRLSVKGAPEVVLASVVERVTPAGPSPFDAAARGEVAAVVERMATRGLRVLAVAEREIEGPPAGAIESLGRLRLVGFVAFSDPVRATAAVALRRLERAGVRTVMLTGDHPSTARAIATELDLGEARRVLSGGELAALDDDELDRLLPSVGVFARVTPAQKVRVVRAFQRAGRVVGMVGDGANDAPAIRLANVGIAIGDHAPAARAAADMVLTDERIETLAHAIVEGRAVWVSVRDAVSILVGGNFGEIGFTVLGGLLDGRPPLAPRQLLLVNLLTDVAPAMAIALRPPSQETLESLAQVGPDAALGAPLNREIALRATVTALGAGTAWTIGRLTGSSARARTIGLVALVGTQLGQTLASGGLTRPVLLTAVGSAATLALVVQTPGLSRLFGCRPLGPVAWLTAVGASAAATSAAVAAPELVRRVATRLGLEPAQPDVALARSGR
ncbi:MAG: HAD-IC family P-type ATPase [Polyangiaceae bacterium]|nr:HAD-IC family P-type ATPase [Polyangiaceae bacterium]